MHGPAESMEVHGGGFMDKVSSLVKEKTESGLGADLKKQFLDLKQKAADAGKVQLEELKKQGLQHAEVLKQQGLSQVEELKKQALKQSEDLKKQALKQGEELKKQAAAASVKK